ncbi:MAG: DUF6178 family protein [Pseudomonadales bacterium]
MPERATSSSRALALRRLTNHPALADIVPTLAPRTLARLFDTVGLHDAGPLMAITPAPLLARALDEAVWVEHATGTAFDPDAFVDWLEVWLEEGDAFTVDRLQALDEDMLALVLRPLLAVDDSTVGGFERSPAEEDGMGTAETGSNLPSLTVGPFTVTAALEDEWDVVSRALTAFAEHAYDLLLMLLARLCMDDSRLEGEAGSRGHAADAAGAREQRRERAGFVPRASAQAFLAEVRSLTSSAIVALEAYDPETARHLSRLQNSPPATDREPSGGAEEAPHQCDDGRTGLAAGQPAARSAADAEIWSLLEQAGVVEKQPPAGLLAAPDAPACLLQQRLDPLAAVAPGALAGPGSELAYLANVLLAVDVLPEESGEDAARDLAFATVNLGLELLEARGETADLEAPPGLVRAFMLAWHTLLGMPRAVARAVDTGIAAPRTVAWLGSRAWLREQIDESQQDLHRAVRDGDTEAAREALALLSLALDTDACRGAAHLLGPMPRFPCALEGGAKEDARWFRSIADLERVAVLLRTL